MSSDFREGAPVSKVATWLEEFEAAYRAPQTLDHEVVALDACLGRVHAARPDSVDPANSALGGTGSVVTPALLALAAARGMDELTVTRRPRVDLEIRDHVTRVMVMAAIGEWGAVAITDDSHVVAHVKVTDTIEALPSLRWSEASWAVRCPQDPYSALVTAQSILRPLLAGLSGRPIPRVRRISMPSLPSMPNIQVLPVRKRGKLWVMCAAGPTLEGAATAEGLAVVDPDGSALLLRF